VAKIKELICKGKQPINIAELFFAITNTNLTYLVTKFNLKEKIFIHKFINEKKYIKTVHQILLDFSNSNPLNEFDQSEKIASKVM
jgi:hypothetical protein